MGVDEMGVDKMDVDEMGTYPYRQASLIGRHENNF